jgi:hypothetical protein
MIVEQYKIFGVPVSQRRTRRVLVVGYWCLVAFFCRVFLLHQAHHGIEDMGPWIVLPAIFNLSGLLGGVRAGGAVKPFSGAHWISNSPSTAGEGTQTLFGTGLRTGADEGWALDERERLERNGVHFVAYTIARWFALLLLAIYAALGAAHVAWFNRIGPFFVFLLTQVLWSLPQSLILWTEPDMEEPQ